MLYVCDIAVYIAFGTVERDSLRHEWKSKNVSLSAPVQLFDFQSLPILEEIRHLTSAPQTSINN